MSRHMMNVAHMMDVVSYDERYDQSVLLSKRPTVIDNPTRSKPQEAPRLAGNAVICFKEQVPPMLVTSV